MSVNRVLGYVVLLALILAVSVRRASADEPEDRVPDDVAITYNVRYRDGAVKDWVLDIAVPKASSDKPRPAIVVIHGGGWIEGDKSSFASNRHGVPGNIVEFAELGFVAVTIN